MRAHVSDGEDFFHLSLFFLTKGGRTHPLFFLSYFLGSCQSGLMRLGGSGRPEEGGGEAGCCSSAAVSLSPVVSTRREHG